MSESVDVFVDPLPYATVDITIGPAGPRGPQGPQGPEGDPATIVTHHQITPAATWTIIHDLNKNPAVVILLDEDPTVPVVTDVFYPDLATVVLEFPSPESGYAYL